MTAHFITRLGPYSEARSRAERGSHEWRYDAGFLPASAPHRVLPESRLSLVTESLFAPTGEILDQSHWVFGPIRTPRLYAPPPGSVLEGMFILPEHALCLFGVRPDELTDAILPQSDFRRLRQPLTEPSRHQDRLAIWAARLLRATKGRVRANALAERAGVSERHLHRCMTGRLGVGPKALAGQIRALAAIERADQSARPNWADIALTSGYSDQAHLSRSLKALTGLTPTALHAERSVESEIFKTAPAL
ncbi:helix-turn-helix domain-containing protein [Oceanicaulis sp.]|uniref:AraC family transcriptional regulator n=1 Tax=Oceanicaulis sp. TaxID=1924941 RepID=UPI003D29E433